MSTKGMNDEERGARTARLDGNGGIPNFRPVGASQYGDDFRDGGARRPQRVRRQGLGKHTLDPQDQGFRQKGIAAQVKEIIMNAHRFDLENIFPKSFHVNLEGVPGATLTVGVSGAAEVSWHIQAVPGLAPASDGENLTLVGGSSVAPFIYAVF